MENIKIETVLKVVDEWLKSGEVWVDDIHTTYNSNSLLKRLTNYKDWKEYIQIDSKGEVIPMNIGVKLDPSLTSDTIFLNWLKEKYRGFTPAVQQGWIKFKHSGTPWYSDKKPDDGMAEVTCQEFVGTFLVALPGLDKSFQKLPEYGETIEVWNIEDAPSFVSKQKVVYLGYIKEHTHPIVTVNGFWKYFRLIPKKVVEVTITELLDCYAEHNKLNRYMIVTTRI